MSSVVQVKLGRWVFAQKSELGHISHFTCPPGNSPAGDESALASDDGGNTPTINDVESLKNGAIKTSKHKPKTPYTILLVGETGVGKSSVLELIANVLHGNDVDHYDFHTLDHTNERGGFDNQSQTNSARLYELTSKNGIVVRILDTPGFADTRHLQQDTLQRESIATQIKSHIDFATAVLILANGTIPRVTLGVDYALSTLSTILPRTGCKNVAFLLTNTSNPIFRNFSGDTLPEGRNFSGDTLPEGFKDAPQFLLNNPIALQRRYLELKDAPAMMGQGHIFREVVKASEQDTLEMLVDLFDWLDGLEPQPISEIVSRFEKLQDIAANVIGPLANFLRKVMENGIRKVRVFL